MSANEPQGVIGLIYAVIVAIPFLAAGIIYAVARLRSMLTRLGIHDERIEKGEAVADNVAKTLLTFAPKALENKELFATFVKFGMNQTLTPEQQKAADDLANKLHDQLNAGLEQFKQAKANIVSTAGAQVDPNLDESLPREAPSNAAQVTSSVNNTINKPRFVNQTASR